MADEGEPKVKRGRGRPARGGTAEVVEVPKAEKRGRPAAAKEDKGDSEPANKRSRGRPKGSGKKKPKAKAKAAGSGGGGRRGRPKKAAVEEKDQSSGAEEPEAEDDE